MPRDLLSPKKRKDFFHPTVKMSPFSIYQSSVTPSNLSSHSTSLVTSIPSPTNVRWSLSIPVHIYSRQRQFPLLEFSSPISVPSHLYQFQATRSISTLPYYSSSKYSQPFPVQVSPSLCMFCSVLWWTNIFPHRLVYFTTEKLATQHRVWRKI